MIIIPDVHGRKFWKTSVKKRRDNEEVVFLGDYVDPYQHEGITKEEAIKNFKSIIRFAKKNKDKVTLLLGNHDLSYLSNILPKCRYDYKNQDEIRDLFINNSSLFKIAYKKVINYKTYLFTHSGIEPEWIKTFKSWDKIFDNVKTDYNYIVDYLNFLWETKSYELFRILNCVSYYRGGNSLFPSCVWGDIRDFTRYNQYPLYEQYDEDEVFQVFGHTLSNKETIEKYFACLDCCVGFRLVDDGTFEYVNKKPICICLLDKMDNLVNVHKSFSETARMFNVSVYKLKKCIENEIRIDGIKFILL